jgi:uncharacterized RDD family membrane protein YckC
MAERARTTVPPIQSASSAAEFQAVRSTEQVLLELPLAGPTSRMLAYAVDLVLLFLLELGLGALLLVVLPSVVQSLLSAARSFVRSDFENADLPLLGLCVIGHMAIELVYFVCGEVLLRGRSPGKAALGLRVVRDGGEAVGAVDSLVRNVLRMVDALPGGYLVGFVTMIAMGEGKRLGDFAAGTVVVRLDRPDRVVPIELLVGEATTAFRLDHAQVAAIGAVELTLIAQLLRRRAELEAQGRWVETLARVVEALRVRLGHAPVPPEEHEDFVRAVHRARRTR